MDKLKQLFGSRMTPPIIALFLICSASLLNGCHHTTKKDGPPNYYVDETKIPNATPRPEPLAKYGNMTSYRVFGKRYYTLKSSRHYEAVGVASWYGTMFHEHRTSSGERYDMLGMTAAHKTLPLPTYVEVTNLKNHRKIIVKVNDRGPFESNRLIDLSYVAAKKLGMLGHGTTTVKVKAIDPYQFAARHSSTQQEYDPLFIAEHDIKKPAVLYTENDIDTEMNAQSHHQSTWQSHTKTSQSVYLQVGAFRNKWHAIKLKQRLLVLFKAPVNISNPAKGTQLYRVKIGPIKDVATANKMTSQLKNLGMSPEIFR